jgi:hypothetical protein
MRIIYLMFLAYALAACGSEQPTTETAATDNTEAHAHDHSHEGHDHAHDHGGEEPKSKDGIHYGEDITAEGALMLNEVADKLAKGEETQDLDLGEGNVVKALDAKVEGTVSEVCKAQGCWLRIKNEEGVEMFVNTNHDFLVDQTIIGKKVVVKGNAYGEEKTVAELQAIAKDAGKSEEEVAAITEAQVDYSLMAKGLIVQ